MSEIPTSEKKFLKEFLTRTKSNLINYQDEFDMTNIINCSLGLIIFPFEFNRGRVRKITPNLFTLPAKDLAKDVGFRFSKFQPIENLDGNRHPILFNENKKSVKLLLNKMRNGLAHQNIRPKNNNGLFDEIVIWNIFERGRGINKFSEKDVSVIFNQDQLKKFALLIADGFLDKLTK
jgi:hypothetical protein